MLSRVLQVRRLVLPAVESVVCSTAVARADFVCTGGRCGFTSLW